MASVILRLSFVAVSALFYGRFVVLCRTEGRQCVKKKKTKLSEMVTERITFRVSPETAEKIRLIAGDRGLVKTSDVIRIALKRLFDMEESDKK